MKVWVAFLVLGLCGCDEDNTFRRGEAVKDCIDHAIKVDEPHRDKALDVCNTLAQTR